MIAFEKNENGCAIMYSKGIHSMWILWKTRFHGNTHMGIGPSSLMIWTKPRASADIYNSYAP